jgi:hypothetical protein
MAADRERLRRLHQAAERISASLVELELDSSRQLLEASALEGESAARWAAASDALTELWRRRALLEELLERADEAERTRCAEQLRSLVDGPSIELAGTDVPLAERTLLGTVRNVERCSPSELIASMSSAFDDVKVVLAAFAAAWEKLIPSVEAARALLQDCARLAEELGEDARHELERAKGIVGRLARAIRSDPLSIAPAEIDTLMGSLREIRVDLGEIAELQRRFDVRLLEARERLERLCAAAREAQAAHEETVLKVSQPPAPPVHGVPADLEAELEAIVELAHRDAWTEARRGLEAWSGRTRALLDEAEQARRANRAPIEARNQFRALLDAYQVKAKRLGRLEDPDVADLYARAHQALYTAPTDLAAAARLVRAYQEALSGLRPDVETVR